MPEFENISQLLEQMKVCNDSEIKIYFPEVFNKFRFLSKAEKNLISESFYNWAQSNITSQSLKLAFAEFIMALNHFTNEENELALEWLSQSRKHFDEHNHDEGIGLCSMLIGAVYRTFGNFELALKILWEAYEILKKSGMYPIALAAAANSIANIDFEMEAYDEALEMFNIAFEESKGAGDFYFNIYALQGLGKVCLIQEKYDTAKMHFEKALDIARQNHHPLHIANSLTELAKYYFRLNEYGMAEICDSQALEIREQHGFNSGIITSYIHLAEIYIRLKKFDDALRYLNKGLALAEHVRIKPKISNIHFLLSEIYRCQGDFKESLFHYQLYHDVKSEAEKEDNVRKLADAKLIFEAEQTKKENVIIKKQKDEIEKKNTELQNTIDELTRTKISRKAKVWTLALIIVLFIFQDWILGTALMWLHSDNYFLLLAVKMGIIFSLSPINKAIEKYLLSKVIKERKLIAKNR